MKRGTQKKNLKMKNNNKKSKKKLDSWFLTPSQPWRLYQGEQEEEEEEGDEAKKNSR